MANKEDNNKESDDRIKLRVAVDMLYMSPRHFETIEATAAEIEIRQTLDKFKVWANKIITEKVP